MIGLVTDENFDGRIVDGLFLRNPDLDLVRVRDVGLSGADDETILEWAARAGRILLTHDVPTMTKLAYDRIRHGLPMPGVFEVGDWLPIGPVIEDLLLLAKCGRPGEWEGRGRFPATLGMAAPIDGGICSPAHDRQGGTCGRASLS